ncbi:MAG: aspartate 1-decarboxylase [Omnitrophica bacterium RIFCSPLOWO2_12_FULL_44_17]|uniref:Aspartate 1-decarboxylase n=1 Tax=Candidatus Danuiimicrobium aquiferis TaxID=1801832 RepID=A0A1G1L214_9BACT|nr:MAG: aspartate 1-decarboxylase [Omnitrophica bacterium RIFCSPHIGHO2_02_FULL_45_28]OGW99203.1 MAG: aspartate 1-decarboxylase [Omnitrophica bacterium RIFCSPLOWO2_12_FULL_44_17]OGX04381.1 MAG: aspartate 1-decarboxylase [Omnitrophica bacterium RIFCSPLOWO2_02_FULL_44_11]
MIRNMLKSKIHGATVTDANIAYEGSITIDEELIDATHLMEYEKVLVANLTNGSRLETYVIKGKRGSGDVCANGAAALHNRPGDKVLIMSFCGLNEEELKNFHPFIVKVDERNRIVNRAERTCSR